MIAQKTKQNIRTKLDKNARIAHKKERKKARLATATYWE
jgi:hypothetical protein